MKNEIVQKIDSFKKADIINLENKYLHGDCYVFAKALANYFNGEIYYLPIENHFITKINQNFYDIRGLLNLEELEEPVVWKQYYLVDSLEYQRIIRDCIQNKENLTL